MSQWLVNADDMAFVARINNKLKGKFKEFEYAAGGLGLEINMDKPKYSKTRKDEVGSQ